MASATFAASGGVLYGVVYVPGFLGAKLHQFEASQNLVGVSRFQTPITTNDALAPSRR
jgi:hypothetical protein